MSDRTVITIGSLPLISGALLLVALQRMPPQRVVAATGSARPTRVATHSSADTAWLGVVVAGQSAELSAELDGRVTEVWAQAGARVQRGQPILQIDSSDAASAEAIAGAELGQRRSDIARARAHWEETRAQLARLAAGGSWIAEQELSAARAAERVAHAELIAARAGASMGLAKLEQQRRRARRHTLEAPFDGVLASCDMDAGDSVKAGQMLAQVISDERQVRFAFPREHLPESGALSVSLALPGGAARVRVESLRPEIDPAAQLIFAVAPLPAHASGLLPGTRVVVGPAETADAPVQGGR